MRNTSIPRTKVDCFTMDALEQIKATLNNQTPQFTNRGGVGKDVRELSDFALQQIKDAVGTNGGGGGGGTTDSPIVRSVWYLRNDTEDEPTKATISYGEAHINYSADLIVLLSSEDEEELSYESIVGEWSENFRSMYDGLQIEITTEFSVDFGNHLTIAIQSNNPRLSVVVDNYVLPFSDAKFESVWACDYNGENEVKLQPTIDFNTLTYSTPLLQDGGFIIASRSDYFTSPLTQNSDLVFSLYSTDGQLYTYLKSNEVLRFYGCNGSYGGTRHHIYQMSHFNTTKVFYFTSTENQN